MKHYFWLIFLCLFSLNASADRHLLTPFPKPPKAPDFSLSDLQGTSHTLSNYQGKVVVLNFWATWCPPCRAEMPSMQRAWEIMRNENMIMIAINVGEAESAVRNFSNRLKLDFPVLLDDSASIMHRWPSRGLPTTFVINPEGKIYYRAIGEREWDSPEILQMLRALKNTKQVEPALQKISQATK